MPETENATLESIEREARLKTGSLTLDGAVGEIAGRLPDALFDLSHLRVLKIHNRDLREISPLISNLSSLEELSINFAQIEDLPRQIEKLTKLTSIDLTGNRLRKCPDVIAGMPGLRAVQLGYNQLEEFPFAVLQLPNLKDLDVSSPMGLSLPDALGQLDLEGLGIGNYSLRRLPGWLANLKNLKTLNVSSNNLDRIPNELFTLNNLRILNLGFNEIAEVDSRISILASLESLHLYVNDIRNLPDSFAKLVKLKEITLQNNRFKEFPSVLYGLPNLESISFDNFKYLRDARDEKEARINEIRALSSQITSLRNLRHLGLDNNPIETPPPEVVARGLESIREYYKKISEVGHDFLYESKLLIVGEGGAGKTTLANKIMDPRYKLDSEEKSTEGIEIKKWSFERKVKKKTVKISVNIWDFGGQEIYHATHQFFLTKRSLYILVADDRKEDTDFYYWLNIIELLSDSSPVIIVKNAKQDRNREIDERQLKVRFANLVAVIATNLATNKGLKELVALIKEHISALPHIGQSLPKNWVAVRKKLEENPANYIGIEAYREVCSDEGLSAEGDKTRLIEYLHDLGVCLHFERDPLLKYMLILKPKWGTDAVYRVLDNKSVIGAMGRFNRNDLRVIWNDAQYADMVDQLLQLMLNFKLCYRIPDAPDSYIAPQLLSLNRPSYGWAYGDNLMVRYEYEFMPKGIVTRLTVAMQSLIAETKLVWKTGVVLEKNGARAEVIEYLDLRQIRVRAGGFAKKEIMAVIIYELEKIHSTFSQLRTKALIPCNCSICRKLETPQFFSVETLVRFASKGQREIQCQESFEMVPVTGLIDDVRTMTAAAASERPEIPSVAITGAVGTIIMQQGGVMDEIRPRELPIRSAWANGTFYLLVLVVVIGGIGYFAQAVPAYTLVLLIMAGVLLVPIVGALQLRNDQGLSEKSFLELMRLTISQLPLLSKLGGADRGTSNSGDKADNKSGKGKQRARR